MRTPQVWLGIGDALAAAVADGKLPLLQQMYDEWPFFKVCVLALCWVLSGPASCW
jgi:phosphoenolpyruvate carboxylase